MSRPTNVTHVALVALACLLLLFIAAACSKPVQNSAVEPAAAPSASPSAPLITSESVVKVEAQPVEIAAGGTADAIVRVTIRSGYHVNANPPTYSYLKATELEVSPGDGVSVDFISYPKAVAKKFPFADKPLAVYEGVTDLKATLKSDKSTRPGQRSISTRLRIQACDDQVCYPPGTLDLAIPVNVK